MLSFLFRSTGLAAMDLTIKFVETPKAKSSHKKSFCRKSNALSGGRRQARDSA
jgi:hypothetical protein